MKKIKLIKQKELAVSIENSIYCDFCGEEDKKVFTSSFDDNPEQRKCVMQICEDCIKQLSRLIQ
jgi:hypothetical protein